MQSLPMMNKNKTPSSHLSPNRARLVQAAYLVVYSLALLVVLVTHTRPAPTFEVFRLPPYLNELRPAIGWTPAESLAIYQAVLLLGVTLSGINCFGIRRASSLNWRRTTTVASLGGALFFASLALFFVSPLVAATVTHVDPDILRTAGVYAVYTAIMAVLAAWVWRSVADY